MAKIAEECEVSKDDVFFELGCGRGRACFWVRCLRGCQVVGIDFVPPFIRAADWVVTKLGMSGIRFLEQDIRYVDYSKASVVYLYGTGFDRMTLESLAEALERLPIGAKVITVSYSMNDYSPTPCFKVEKIFPVHFNWGEGRVFYQSKQKAVY
jgi:SAM-dependent methyltransferase